MSNVAIRIEGLSKKFRIGASHEQYRTLRGAMTNAFTTPLRRALFAKATSRRMMSWALSGVMGPARARS